MDKDDLKELIKNAKKTFGLTNSCSRAGYILPDGSMIDFGDPYDKNRDERTFEHWMIGKALKEDYPTTAEEMNDLNLAIGEFVERTNSIRAIGGGTVYGVDLPYEEVTREQWNRVEDCSCHPRIKGLIVDYWGLGNEEYIHDPNCSNRITEAKKLYARRPKMKDIKKSEG